MASPNDMYARASSNEIAKLNKIALSGPYDFVFTKDYLVNGIGRLHIVKLCNIRTIRYKKYYYVFWHGTKMIITENNGRKHKIYRFGPSSKDWKSYGLANKLAKIVLREEKVDSNISY